MKQQQHASSSKHLLRYFLILLLFLFTIFIISFHSSTFHHISSFDDSDHHHIAKAKSPPSSLQSPSPTKRQESDSTFSKTTTKRNQQNHHEQQQQQTNKKSATSPTKLITWNLEIYLPVPKESIAAFKKYQDRQKERLHLNLWSPIKRNSTQEQNCLAFTPECRFFREIQTSILFDKCCAEHKKLKEALTYTIRAIEDCNDREHEVEEDDEAHPQKIKLFLDSGTLLSDSRDGGDTLVPWETDIDLGVVGAWPQKIDSCFKKFQSKQFQGYFFSPYDEETNPDEEDHDDQGVNININNKKTKKKQNNHIPRHHYFESCKRKKSANKSRDGTCSDAFYVYYAKNSQGASHDTSRVEIWPFREDGVDLVHPTRKKLTVPRDVVLPLLPTNCIHHHRQKQQQDDEDNDDHDEKYYFWGIPKRKKESTIEDVLFCPHKTNEYLDNEYGPTWRWPKTIHWGENNAPSWNKKEGK